MASRKMMKSVLRGFLGTYASRYSEFDGYLLFGFLVVPVEQLEVDLWPYISPAPVADPIDTASVLARDKFRDQLHKAGLSMSVVQTATLLIRRGAPQPCHLYLHGAHVALSGFEVFFDARVVMDTGRVYEEQRCVCIAPQDPAIFTRSGRHPASVPNKRFNLMRRAWRTMVGDRRTS